ncbi:uncharacterized protein LOC110859374 [Folsomia candida]|uniref:Uncharacterized protein n=1 Tax=Folsomia candida TaxID=158441 RepID=A0A226DCH6_FOLCA|nr:uncharacterized protein LOC110859374 [Folsomia candida]OXA42628.1 hypothetical protein Fcan01_22524 [Folsomia candida]
MYSSMPSNGTDVFPKSGKCRDLMISNCEEQCKMQGQPVDILMRKLNRMSDIRVSGGPFHYQMRAGGYGEVYDEPGWKVDLGLADIKERSGLEENPMKCRYERRVLLNNWVEERRDRQHIKYDNAPKLSEYGHVYKSEYSTSFTKPLCNKAREMLLKIKSFPITVHPGHQPDLDIPVVRCSLPKPESCILDEETVKMKKDLICRKRYARHANEVGGG